MIYLNIPLFFIYIIANIVLSGERVSRACACECLSNLVATKPTMASRDVSSILDPEDMDCALRAAETNPMIRHLLQMVQKAEVEREEKAEKLLRDAQSGKLDIASAMRMTLALYPK
jgi:hypothetical protein